MKVVLIIDVTASQTFFNGHELTDGIPPQKELVLSDKKYRRSKLVVTGVEELSEDSSPAKISGSRIGLRVRLQNSKLYKDRSLLGSDLVEAKWQTEAKS